MSIRSSIISVIMILLVGLINCHRRTESIRKIINEKNRKPPFMLPINMVGLIFIGYNNIIININN